MSNVGSRWEAGAFGSLAVTKDLYLTHRCNVCVQLPDEQAVLGQGCGRLRLMVALDLTDDAPEHSMGPKGETAKDGAGGGRGGGGGTGRMAEVARPPPPPPPPPPPIIPPPPASQPPLLLTCCGPGCLGPSRRGESRGRRQGRGRCRRGRGCWGRRWSHHRCEGLPWLHRVAFSST